MARLNHRSGAGQPYGHRGRNGILSGRQAAPDLAPDTFGMSVSVRCVRYLFAYAFAVVLLIYGAFMFLLPKAPNPAYFGEDDPYGFHRWDM